MTPFCIQGSTLTHPPPPPSPRGLTTLVSDHLRAGATSLFSLYHLVVQRQSLPSSTFQLVRVRAALVGIPLSYEDLLFVFPGSFHSSGGISSSGKTCLSSRVRLSDFARYSMTIRFVFVPCFFFRERMKRVVFAFGKLRSRFSFSIIESVFGFYFMCWNSIFPSWICKLETVLFVLCLSSCEMVIKILTRFMSLKKS